MQQEKTFKYAFFTLSSLLFSFILYKAIILPFTHDAAFTYRMLYHPEDSKLMWKLANNHPINTLFMWLSYHLLPKLEIVFRWQNVLAFIIYAFYSFKLTKFLVSIHLKYLLAGLLLLNLFILDFFSLARGYGLCVAFLIPCFYYALEAVHFNYYAHKNWAKAFLFGCLSMASVYISINIYLGLIALFAIHQLPHLKSISFFNLLKKNWRNLLLIVIPTLLVINALLIIKHFGDLGYGADNSLVKESFSQYAKCILQSESPNSILKIMVQVVWYIGLATGLIALISTIKKRQLPKDAMLFCVLLIAFVLYVIQHSIFGTPYPMGRTMNPIYVLWAVSFVFALNAIYTSTNLNLLKKGISYSAALVILLVCLNFAANVNFDRCFKWYYNANDREVASFIEDEQKRLQKPLEMGVFFRFGTTLPFYYLHHLHDSKQLNMHRYRYNEDQYKDAKNCHYVYILKHQFDYLDKAHPFEKVKEFANSQTVLVRNKNLVD